MRTALLYCVCSVWRLAGRFFYARPNREGEPEGAGPGCGNVRFVEGGGAILYGFKIVAAIYYPFG